jgi:hypothetical protein
VTEFYIQLVVMVIAATIIASWRSTPAEFALTWVFTFGLGMLTSGALTWVFTFGLGMLTSGTVGIYRDYCRKRRRNRREGNP